MSTTLLLFVFEARMGGCCGPTMNSKGNLIAGDMCPPPPRFDIANRKVFIQVSVNVGRKQNVLERADIVERT